MMKDKRIIAIIAGFLVIAAAVVLLVLKGGSKTNQVAIKYDRIVNSASTQEEAKEFAKDEFNDNQNKITENEIIEETEFYYGIRVSWTYESASKSEPEPEPDPEKEAKPDSDQNSSHSYSENIIAFKKDVYNFATSYSSNFGRRTLVNSFGIKDKDKIKEILDIFYSIDNKNNASFKWRDSSISENDENYIYTLNYIETVYGDYGVEDVSNQKSLDVMINKETGKVN